MKSDNNEIKKQVIEDWLTAFPPLSKYRKHKFYKVVGPLLVGIDLMVLMGGDRYRPYFVCYPLWGGNIKECMAGPQLLIEFTNRKGLQPTVAYDKHAVLFPDIAACVREQMPINLDGDVRLDDILELIDAYSDMPPLSVAPASYLMAGLREFKLELFLIAGGKEEMRKELDEIRKVKWDEAHFSLCNVKVEDWLSRLEDKGKRRDEFLANIESAW